MLPSVEDFNWFSPKILIIKESCNLIAWKVNLATSNQTTTFQMMLLLEDITWFFPEILMVKIYCNLIDWKRFRIRFFPDMCILENHKELFKEPFLEKKRNVDGLFFSAKVKKLVLGEILGIFPKTKIFQKPKTNWLCQFLTLKILYFHVKLQKRSMNLF